MFRLVVKLDSVDNLKKAIKVLKPLDTESVEYELMEDVSDANQDSSLEARRKRLMKTLPSDVKIEWSSPDFRIEDTVGAFPDFPDIETLRRKAWGRTYTK